MTTPTDTTKRPTHTAFIVKDQPGQDKPDWIKVGAGWEHGDGDGLNVSLNILGQTITVSVRKNKAKA